MKETQPTRDDLLAMAYVDGELATDEREAFATRMKDEPGLARAVVEYQRLELLAREIAPPEPADHEWERIRSGALHAGGSRLAWLLLLVGGVGLAVWVLWSVATSDMDLVPKALFLGLAAGLTLLFLLVLRSRVRQLPLDPYTEVRR